MRPNYKNIILVTSFLIFSFFAQSQEIKNLSSRDFEYLEKTILEYNPQIPVREKVEGYSFIKEFKQLKQEWYNSDEEQHYQILDKMLGLCHDMHAIFVNPKNLFNIDINRFDTLGLNNEYELFIQAIKKGNRSRIPVTVRYTAKGEYLVVSPIEVISNEIKIQIGVGDKVKSANGIPLQLAIDKFNRFSMFRQYDFIRHIHYQNTIGAISLSTDSLVLDFIDTNKNLYQVDNRISKFIIKRQFPEKNNFLTSRRNEKIVYDSSNNLVYIDLPVMSGNTRLPDLLKELNNDKPIDLIIIDIRGNLGGNDLGWMKLMSAIISDTIKLPNKLIFRNQPEIIEYLKKNGIAPDHEKPEKIPILDNSEYYTTEFTQTIKPDSVSIHFKGKIYIIRDEEIFSSALAFVMAASQNEQFITIGQTGGYLGGRGITPMYFQLPESKLVFQMEPVMDMSNVIELKDFYHQIVEIPVNYSDEDIVNRYSYDGDLFNFEFLKKYDPIFKKIIEMEALHK